MLATLTGHGNIIENAENVVGKYNNSVIKEQELLNTIIEYLKNDNSQGSGEEEQPIESEILDNTEIASDPDMYYGQIVSNYTTPDGDPNVKWQIFYADQSNIYLIANDYIHYDYTPATVNNYMMYKNHSDYKLSFNSVYKDYVGSESITDSRVKKWIQEYLDDKPTSTSTTIRATAYMLDANLWSEKYRNSTYAEYAIGGPTLEMFVASYNQTHPSEPIYYKMGSSGYSLGWSENELDTFVRGVDIGTNKVESLYAVKDRSKASEAWLASPANTASMLCLDASGSLDGYGNGVYTSSTGLRPIVCLNRDTKIEKNKDGTLAIAEVPEMPYLVVDKTDVTANDIEVTINWKTSNTNLVKLIRIGNGEWKEYTGETTKVTIKENCTVYARLKDKLNQTLITGTLTITNIDKTKPTVIAPETVATIIEGESYDPSECFTIIPNGIANVSNITCTDISNGNEIITNTNKLSVGTHNVKCTVTKETGLMSEATRTIKIVSNETKLSAKEIATVPGVYYGQVVSNYTTPNGDPDVEWQIFYAGETNIYLIANNYIHYDYCPTGANGTAVTKNSDYKLSFNSVYKDYVGSESITDSRIKKWIQEYLDDKPTSTSTTIRATAYMLDTNVWNEKYKNSTYAEYAIGGPTLEMFVASYNQTHSSEPIYYKVGGSGYNVGWLADDLDTFINGVDMGTNKVESLYAVKDRSKASEVWLASPANTASMLCLDTSGSLDGYGNGVYTSSTGLRPIVCLQSNVQLEKQSDGTYLIK